MSPTITHHPDQQAFFASPSGPRAELTYTRPAAGVIDFTHTFVAEELRGQGIGEQLARAALRYAQQQQVQVRTSCAFMRSFVARHAEYQPLLEPQR